MSVIINVIKLLAESNRKLAVAESCTGGMISAAVTDIPGSSAVFGLGIVAYSDTAKVRQLGVEPKLLDEYGAVSGEVALAMASGVRNAANADFGLAVTGIAGPTGGTAEKPVGTVYIAAAGPESSCCHLFNFDPENDRQSVREETVSEAMKIIHSVISSTAVV